MTSPSPCAVSRWSSSMEVGWAVMASPQKVVLIACGSYNPVTNMHLRMFELARDALNKTGQYRVIAGIISPVSDHYQKQGLIEIKHRYNMIKLALKTSDWIRLDTWEGEQKTWVETAHVLAHHKAVLDIDYNANMSPTRKSKMDETEIISNDEKDKNIPYINVADSDCIQLKLLCGADLLESFGKPGLWKEEHIEHIVGRHGLVCITRSGTDPRQFIYESDSLTKYQENIIIVTEWIQNEISATKIRRALRRGESVKYLLQDSVIDYIEEHQLYSFFDNKYMNHIIPSPNDDGSPNNNGEEVRVVFLPTAKYLSPQKVPSSPKRQCQETNDNSLSPSPKHVPCMADISSLVRRMKNARIAFTPETCV